MADSMASLNTFSAQDGGAKVDANKKVRIGVIGCGWIAGTHVNCLLNEPDAEIVAGCDLVPGKARAFFDKIAAEKGVDLSGVKTEYADHREMLADKSLNLDAVTICTYNRQHAQPAIDALNAGIHVLLEKPFTVTLDEAVKVMRAEKKSGKILSLGFQPRMSNSTKLIKKICQSGELGKIYYIQTGGGRRRGIPTPYGTTFIEDETAGIGALGDIGCYSLDLVLNAIGYPKPLTVSGYKSAYFGTDPNYCGYPEDKKEEYAKKFGVDDFAAAFIRLEGDIILDFRIGWAQNLDTAGDTIIMGTKGSLRIPSTECWNGSIKEPLKIYHEVAGEQVETVIETPQNKQWIFQTKIRTFLDAVKTNGKAPVSSAEILYNQAIIDGIFKSAELGREVEIVIPEI